MSWSGSEGCFFGKKKLGSYMVMQEKVKKTGRIRTNKICLTLYARIFLFIQFYIMVFG